MLVAKPAIFVVVVALACYSNSVGGEFVFDDTVAIVQNPDVQPGSSLSALFTNDFWGVPMRDDLSHKSYRPFTVLTFRLNHWLGGGLNPSGFHIFNILAHAVVCWLFHTLCLLHIFPQDRGTALLAALLFATHPVHTEAVASIVGRAELLSACFFLVALLLYLPAVHHGSSLSGWRILGSALLSAVAMLCKEQGVTAIGVCAMLELLLKLGLLLRQQGGHSSQKTSNHASCVARVLGLTGVALLLLYARLVFVGSTSDQQFQRHDNPAAFVDSATTSVMTRAFLWTYNLWLLIWPSNLCCDYTHGSIALLEAVSDWRNLASAFAFASCGAAVVMTMQHSHREALWQAASFGAALLVVPFIPASSLFLTVGFVVAERTLYIPSMGICVLLALLLQQGVASCSSRAAQRQLVLAGLAVCIAWSAKTAARNLDWATPEQLFRSGVVAQPLNSRLLYNVGNILQTQGKRQESERYYRLAIRFWPSHPEAHVNLGRWAHYEDPVIAEQHYRIAVASKPDFHTAHNHLASVLTFSNPDESIWHSKLAVALQPREPENYFNLGMQHQERNPESAQHYYKLALQIRPHYAEAYLNLGMLKASKGRKRDALQAFQSAVASRPADSGVVANAYVNMGSIIDSEPQRLRFYKLAAKAQPFHPQALNNVGLLTKDPSRAAWFIKAMQVAPTFPDAHFNFAHHHHFTDPSLAERHYRIALSIKPDFQQANNNLAVLLQGKK